MVTYDWLEKDNAVEMTVFWLDCFLDFLFILKDMKPEVLIARRQN